MTPQRIIDDPGYMAKRMEIGAVIGASPKENVIRETPMPGDAIVPVSYTHLRPCLWNRFTRRPRRTLLRLKPAPRSMCWTRQCPGNGIKTLI